MKSTSQTYTDTKTARRYLNNRKSQNTQKMAITAHTRQTENHKTGDRNNKRP